MAISMMANGKIIEPMALGNIHKRMVKFMKGSGKMTNLILKASSDLKTGQCSKENSKMGLSTDSESITGLINRFIEVSGNIINSMAKVNTPGTMGENILANGKII